MSKTTTTKTIMIPAHPRRVHGSTQAPWEAEPETQKPDTQHLVNFYMTHFLVASGVIVAGAMTAHFFPVEFYTTGTAFMAWRVIPRYYEFKKRKLEKIQPRYIRIKEKRDQQALEAEGVTVKEISRREYDVENVTKLKDGATEMTLARKAIIDNS